MILFVYKGIIWPFFSQSQEIATEGELRIHSVDDSDKVRELQDKVADLQAEVSFVSSFTSRYLHR